LLLTLASSVYIAVNRPVRHWYAARALAESVKTIAWRYACKVDPFGATEASARSLFIERICSLIAQNASVSGRSPADATLSQVSAEMTALRTRSAPERLEFYISNRVSEQLHWYTTKAQANERMAKILFTLILFANTTAVVFAVVRVHYFSTQIWPTDVLVTISACILTWYQAKKSGELSASYGLAAHEITALRDAAPAHPTDEELSQYIEGAESAFSREHTQWIARQDH